MTAALDSDPGAGDRSDTRPLRTSGLGRTVDGAPLPSARDRLGPLADGRARMWGWLGPLAVTVIGGVLRFWHLGRPHDVLFDETYYAKDAWSLLRFGYVRDTVEKADEQVLQGNTDGIFTSGTSFYVHPDAGKWLIAAGEWAFGMDPFGWRVAAAAAGTLTILVLARLVLRLTGSVVLGSMAGLLLAVDGLHFVMSRIALLDVFLAFFLVSAVACLVADRDWGRKRLRDYLEAGGDGFGPVFWLRPWRIAAGICFGLAVGTKWNGLFALAAFGLLVWLWDSSARKAIGVRWAWLKSAVFDAVPAFFSLVGVALVVYVATWGAWLANSYEYDAAYADEWGTYAQTDASGIGEAEQSLRSLVNWHGKMWEFHNGDGIRDATHPYDSHPAGWLIINRPVGIAVETEIIPGKQGCPQAANECITQILAIGTPALWWGGVLALAASLLLWLGGRDWRYGVALVGVLANWLPWFNYADRPIFYFYAVTIIPFTIVALCLVIGRMCGPADHHQRRRRHLVGLAVSAVFVVLVVANFVHYYPIYTEALLTHGEWLNRIWFSHWI